MLLLNDQLRHHLESWDNENFHEIGIDEVIRKEDEGKNMSKSSRHCEGKNTSKSGRHCEDEKAIKPSDLPKWIASIYGPFVSKLRECILLIFIQIILTIRGRIVFFSMETILFVLSYFQIIFYNKSINPTNRTTCENLSLLRLKQSELSTILAEIGAPPLTEKYVNKSMLSPVLISKQIELAKVYHEYLCVVDDALERLQSARSIYLGLGIWSPAAERVRTGKKNIFLWKSKETLAQGLIQPLQFKNMNISKPAVVTIGWLRSIRRNELPHALTKYLEVLLKVKQVDECCQYIREITTYLRGSFLDIRKISESETAPIKLIAQQLHAAEVALWSYCNDTQQDDLSSKQQWMEKFENLIKSAQAIYAGTSKESILKTEICSESSNSVEKCDKKNCTTFEDAGRDLSICKNDISSFRPREETLVYFGKGSKERKFQVSSSNEISVNITNSRSKAALLNELHTHLAKIEKVPERIVSMDRGEIDTEEENVDFHDKISLSTFELPNNILSELRTSINEAG